MLKLDKVVILQAAFKLLTTLAFLIAALSIAALPAHASDDASNNSWEKSDFEYCNVNEMTSGTGAELQYPDGFEMYGCDYSRQFYINGRVVTGFSDAGKKKLGAGNTDLVIPRYDDQGNEIVGVGKNAFQSCGLTSVKFPACVKTEYEDSLTKNVTRRGNFVIFDAAFSQNKITEVNLPDGVIAVMTNAFKSNSIKQVTFPRTIWWIETLSFDSNQIENVIFPQTTDFQLEIKGNAFSNNKIKQFRMPNFTSVLNENAFMRNTGSEAVSASCPNSNLKSGVACPALVTNAPLSAVPRRCLYDSYNRQNYRKHQILGAKTNHRL